MFAVLVVYGHKQGSPYGLALFGMIFIVIGAYAMNSGRIWVRFQGWTYRDREPRRFWGEVVTYFVCGAAILTYFMYLGTTVGYPPLW